MAQNTLEFIINIGGDAYKGVASLDAAMGKLNVNANKTATLFDRISNRSIQLNNIFEVTQKISNRIGKALSGIIDVGTENELQKLDLTTLFRGNAEAADDMFNRISEYGKVTVYDKAGLIDAQKLMMAYGISGEKSFETLKQIGDISMGSAQKMQSISMAFAQASSLGKLTTNDFKQMTLAGFNPLQVIAEKTGRDFNVLKEEMEKGAISAEMLAQAFQWATEEGGLFYQGAERAGNSTGGKIAQLKDTFDEFLIGVFYKLQPVINACLDFATRFLEGLPVLVDGIQQKVTTVMDVISNISPILIGLAAAIGIVTIAINANKIALMAQELWLNILILKETLVAKATAIWSGVQAVFNAIMAANPIVLIIAAIAVLVGAIVWVCSKITGWGSLWEGVTGFMKYSFFAFVDAIKLYFTTFINGFMMGIDKIKLGWYKFKESMGIGDSEENHAAIESINADVERRKEKIKSAAMDVVDNAKKAKESLAGIEMGWKKKEDKQSEDSTETASSGGMFSGLMDKVAPNTGGGTTASGNGGTGNMARTTEAIASGGTRNSTTNITIGKMADMVFNGGFKENAADIKSQFESLLLQVLYMAQNAG